jgi:hypothetical protein
MSEQLQLRRGTSAQVAAFIGAQGEVVVDATNNRIVVQDGATAGGFAAAKLSEVLLAAGGSVTAVGVGTAADSGNPLSVKASTALFSALSTDFRVVVNKAASGNTASLLYQDGFSGRAEIGLMGDDNFHFKVSSNGASWIDALDINATTGIVSAAMGFSGSPDPTYLRGFLAGLTLANDATSPNTVLDIAAGVANADDNSLLMKLGAAITKTTGAWAAGSGNGALDTGTVAASAWYHAYLIARTDTGAVDALFSQSATSPTMPSGYTKKRRIGAILTDASAHIVAFSQNGDEFLWATSVNAANTVIGTSATLIALAVPPGVKVNALLRGYVNTTNGPGFASVLINSPDEAGVGSNATVGNVTQTAGASSLPTAGFGMLNVRTNTSQQIRAVSASASGNILGLATFGWIDMRGHFN